MQSVNNSIYQFLSTLHVTTELQSASAFQTQIDLALEQNKHSASTALVRLLFSLRAVYHGNGLISTYGSNFYYKIPRWFPYGMTGSKFEKIRTRNRARESFFKEKTALYIETLSFPGLYLALSEPVSYDGGCSCALHANCTTQAVFMKSATEVFAVKGLKMGCTPSESFLASTLECFYDALCVNLIKEYTNSKTETPELLSANSSRFAINTTLTDLVNSLFIETWSTFSNYSAYFHQCRPAACSYTYIQQFNSLYTVVLLFGLYGGISFALRWMCPRTVYLLFVVYRWRKKRSARVRSVTTIEAQGAAARSDTTSPPK